ncbi:hypothetical protein PFL603g_05469 [Pseudomonas fluorescens]|uniref:Uncharacterized protein n=1 Tax=Pseudomonas fluorescens TaxID=294 RepID=A0A109KKC0_PSEFL|nr:hypothetical protein PFL603g_05469 [Pseudomonas fluorescens]
MDLEKISHRVAPWVLPILLLAVWCCQARKNRTAI